MHFKLAAAAAAATAAAAAAAAAASSAEPVVGISYSLDAKTAKLLQRILRRLLLLRPCSSGCPSLGYGSACLPAVRRGPRVDGPFMRRRRRFGCRHAANLYPSEGAMEGSMQGRVSDDQTWR